MSKRFLVTVFMLLPMVSSAQDVAYCGDEGVWLQILGSGGSDITDQRSAASYVVWNGEHARLMVDTGSGSALRFDEAGADFADLDAIVFTRLQAYNTVDLPSLLEGSLRTGRERVLPVLGPADPNGESTSAFIERLIGADGAYPYLSRFPGRRLAGGLSHQRARRHVHRDASLGGIRHGQSQAGSDSRTPRRLAGTRLASRDR